MRKLKWQRNPHTQSKHKFSTFISRKKQPLGPVLPCSRSAAWSTWFCRLYCTVLPWISALVYFDSLCLMSWLHLQFEAVWRKAIQRSFAACFVKMLSWQLPCAKKPSSTLVLSHMEANHISAPVHSGVTPSCVSPHQTVTPHSISLRCWAQLPAMQKENTKGGVSITCLAHYFTFSECRRYPWVPLWPSEDLFVGTGILEQSWACILLQTFTCYSALSVAVHSQWGHKILSDPQILGLQGDTVHHLGQTTAALLTPQGINGVGSLLILLLRFLTQSSSNISWHTPMSSSTISSVS